ncbi:hypothetical protein NUW58_g2494 [Xylaria curta]|uniref:Uncharacterized protein n=1 Tax=Xylaria curta TaxID=42375 RepID=A0ACC1PI25_9PEZI|nr:hypothetical protein NUW58_g2494 [Xylaria curta]
MLFRQDKFTKLRLTNNNRESKQQNNIGQAGDSAPSPQVQSRGRRPGQSKRVVSEQEVQQRTYPDVLGLRKSLGGEENLAFVYDYKAAHELTVDDLKPVLVKEELFMEVVQRFNENKTKTDDELKVRDNTNTQVVIALTQVFHYMVHRGVKYGYVTAGTSLVFLHIRLDDPRTLHRHLCALYVGAANVTESHTTVAQLASFCLLALEPEPPRTCAQRPFERLKQLAGTLR